MRAPEDEHVDVHLDQRVEVLFGDQSSGSVFSPAFLDERHEERARLRVHARVRQQPANRLVVRARTDRARRADDADAAVARRVHGAARGRDDDLHDRHLVPFTRIA